MHEYFMKMALVLAQKAYELNEVPIGAIIVKENKIISTGYNLREFSNCVLSHAEIVAIKSACSKLSSWRLINCDLYTTLEPCPMCAGAILNARISNVIFGAFDSKNGAAGSVTNIFDMPFTHKTNVISGIMHKECSKILTKFFSKLRN